MAKLFTATSSHFYADFGMNSGQTRQVPGALLRQPRLLAYTHTMSISPDHATMNGKIDPQATGSEVPVSQGG
jgi:hypothetical protein